MQAFKKGFYEVIPRNLMVQAFNAKELELMISGLPTIDCKNILKYCSSFKVDDLKSNTVY